MEQKSKEVFISYHMNSSTDIVEKISAALEGAGISSWYAKRDIDGGYAGAIIDAIQECKVFLLVLNQYSSVSAHCLNEINAVFDRFSKRENVAILPFKIDKCELSKDAYYYLGRIRMFDGSLPPEMERVAELVDRISVILGRQSTVEKTVQDNNTREIKTYSIAGNSVSKSNSFVGRKEELELIHSKLSQHPNKLLMVGMGGIGKSEISKAYCDIYREDYDAVMWVSFDTSLQKTISNDFSFPIKGIDRSDYPDCDDRAYFMEKLKVLKEIADRRVLIVLDNFDVADDEDMDLFCSGNYSILFTTRYHQISDNVPEVEIKEITDENDLMALFSAEYCKTLNEAAQKEVKALIQQIGGHPLSIRLAASAMKSSRISPETMRKIVGKNADVRDKSAEKAAETIKARLKQVFSVSALSEQETAVLKNLVLMPLNGIDVKTFYDWCDFDDYDVIDGLIQKSWVVHNSAEDKVNLHPIVKDLMKDELKKDLSVCNRLVESLMEALDRFEYCTLEEKYVVIECFASASADIPDAHPRVWDVKWGMSKSVKHMSRYDESRELMRALAIETEDRTKLMYIYNEIAHGYVLTGRPAEGIEEAEKGIALIEGIPLEELSYKQRQIRKNLYTRLNEANRTLGNLEYSEKCMRMIIEDSEKFPEENTASSGWYYMHLARVLAQKKQPEDFKESQQLLEKSKAVFEKYGNESAVGYTHMVWGMLRMYEGRYEEALAENALATRIIGETIGNHHADMGKLKLFEANIYRSMGDEDTALRCYRQSEEMLIQRNNPLLAQKVHEVMESGKIGYTN